MRFERLIYSVLIVVATLVAVIQWRRAALFQSDNEVLRGEVESLEIEAETANRLLETTRDQSEQIRAQAAELEKLRRRFAGSLQKGTSNEVLVGESQALKGAGAAPAAQSGFQDERSP